VLEFQIHCGLRPFRLRSLDDISDYDYGIYGFWYDKHCIYIGKAKEQPIKERLKQHWKGSHNPILSDWISGAGRHLCYAYLAVPDKGSIDVHERYYIRRFQPIANTVRYDLQGGGD
jgi:hypothetical protein